MDKASEVSQYTSSDVHAIPKAQNRQASKKTIPKFASFRPKEGSPQPPHQKSTVKQYPSHDEYHVIAQNRKNRPSQGEGRRLGGTRHKANGSSSTVIDSPGSSHTIAEPRGNAFIVDRAGDPKNLAFGTIDRYAIPLYSRIGAGTVIGSNLALKIDRSLSNEKGLTLSTQDSAGRHGKHPLRDTVPQTTQEFRVKGQAGSEDAWGQGFNYVPLGCFLPIKRKRGHDSMRFTTSSSSSSSDDESASLASTLGKAATSKKHNDADLKPIGDADAVAMDRHRIFDSLNQRKRLDLTRRIDSEPHSVEAWLQLISHHGDSLGPRPTRAERRSTADIKMSLYEEALHAVKDSEGRQRLLVEMMAEAPNLWDNPKVSARWSQVLKSNPDSQDLWIGYLDFTQTEFPSFRYEKVQNIFFNCLQILRESIKHNSTDSLEHQKLHVNQIFVTLRMTLYMRESGFSEHALAGWQAMLEFEYCTPSSLSLTGDQGEGAARQGKLAAFESFWESEVARIGEEGAKGWASFMGSNGHSREQGKGSADLVSPNGNDLFSTWIAMEHTKALQSRQPARTTDDTIEDDPYRMILFSDIEPFLITSPAPGNRSVLLNAFLIFCQLPLYGEDMKSEMWYRQAFFRNEALYFDNNYVYSDQSADLRFSQCIGEGSWYPDLFEWAPPDLMHSDIRMDSEILFAQPRSWFPAFDIWQKSNDTRQSPVEPAWVLDVLKALLMSDIADEQLAEYVLAFELCHSPQNARRTAKNLLKRQTSSLRLYNAYALIEFRLGNADKAEDVLVATINMSKDLTHVDKLDCILLWRTWIWQLLSNGKSSEAFSRLRTYGDPVVESLPHHISGEGFINPAKTLRAESAFRAFRDYVISFRFSRRAVLAMECLILFEYLKDTSTLAAATAEFTTNLHLLSINFSSDKSSEVLLRQSFARLLYHHATHEHLFKPSDIRALLGESVARFPTNTIFLSLYAWNETRFRLDDRVRSIIQDVLLGFSDTSKTGKDNVGSHLFAIHTEMNRNVGLGSNDNAIRATFERAIDSRCGMHCAGIWKMYFLFEYSKRDLKKATTVFHRSIRACPWVKELYLLPFDYLRDGPGAMRKADLKGVYDLMMEKELRVHVDLETLIEQRAG